jgi:hypothetical protein
LIACLMMASVRSCRVAAITRDVATKTGNNHSRYCTEIPIFNAFL